MNDGAKRPLVGLTMGDAAGIGPEVICRAWTNRRLHDLARPIVIGDARVLERARHLVCPACELRIQTISALEEGTFAENVIPCLAPAGGIDELTNVRAGTVDPRAGRAAFEFLAVAADLALAGRLDAITTLPLNKQALNLAGVRQSGHTEILAERCGVADHAMMLYLETSPLCAQRSGHDARRRGTGLGVVHVTLHVALRTVFELLDPAAVLAKIRLAHRAMTPLTNGLPPRIAVASLNPHAGEAGLFGDEEQMIIQPAVSSAQREGIDVSGPYPNDTLFRQALAGAFDAVVAMYHDQGHIALKTVGFDRAVNVTLGLPIVRTSVAHGTAFDIAWQGKADPSSLIEAVRVAARLVKGPRGTSQIGRRETA
jgi:4-hydroxythreonine-4-phosphate dehydrogenase